MKVSGLRSGRGPLTRGQRMVFESLSRRSADADYTYNLDRVVPVPAGTTDVTGALHALVARHDALHTRFLDGPVQVVDAGGELPVSEHATVEEARRAVGAPFDVSAEWGVRAAVVSRRERPRAVVLGLSHLAVDAWAAGVVVDDLRDLLRGKDKPAVRQPLDQAATERTPEARAEHKAAIDYLRDVLRATPPASDVAVDPDGWHLGELRSGAVDQAARATAARLRTTPAVVYLAAAATVLHSRLVKAIAHNRQTPAELSCVAPFALDLFVPVDPAGSFDDTVARTWASYREAARHSRYDPAALPDLIDEVTAERGSAPDLSVLVNDLRPARPARPALSGSATFRWGEPFRLPGLTRYLAIAEDPALSLLANESALSRSDLPTALHELAELMS